MSALPVIDFTHYDEHDENAVVLLSKAVDQALSEFGFMAVRNLGLSADGISNVFDAAKDFFEGDSEVKNRCAYLSASENFGYQGMAEEHLDPSAPADLKETFTMRRLNQRAPDASRWPDEVFAQLMTGFYARCLEASFRLMHVIATALGLPPEFFAQHHSGENVTLRLLHYPAVDPDAVHPGQLGAGAHTDYGLLTLLFQREAGGLEVQQADGRWLPVAADPDLIVINAGDLLEVWTNGHYRSTRHRVQPKTGNSARQSMAMFVDPDSRTEVAPLDSCISAGRPRRFSPTTAGAHLQSRIEASHKARFDA